MSAASRIESLERRVKADPTSVAFASLAEEYRRGGRLGEAIETSRSGLERHPTYASARVTLARALQELGEFEDARAEFETVLALAPENLAAIRGLAEIHRYLGDRAESLEYLERALALAPLDADLQATIAELEAQIGASPPSAPPADTATPSEAAGPPSSGEPAPAELGPFSDVDQTDSDFGELPGFEPPFDLPPGDVVTDVPSPGAAEEPGGAATPDPVPAQHAAAARPFAPAEGSGAESREDAHTPDVLERLETLRRQEAALEHFLAEILKERGRRAS